MAWQRGQRELTNLKVGSAVLFGLLILIFGSLWGQDLLRTGRTHRITVVFESGFGLSTGDPVLVAGVKKGQVSGIALTPDNRVAVEMRIDNDVQLFTSSLFTIESEGLIGARFINVTSNPGGTVLAPTDTLLGGNAASLNDIFRNIQRLATRVEELIGTVQSVISDEDMRQKISQTYDNFNQTINLLNQVVVDNQDMVRESIENLGSVVVNVNKALVDNTDDLEGALQSIKSAGDQFSVATTTVDSLSGALRDLVVRFVSGQGTIWRLTESDSLYVQMITTFARLDSLILDFKNNPKKYIRLSIF
ncbi:MAG: MCE family protein [Candidatus Latescibacteria bacterium]|nr:MCE family protein [Candidatus Latescibacterota bacterium]